MWKEITRGELTNLHKLVDWEEQIDEGQRTRLRLALRFPLPGTVTEELQRQLVAKGVIEANVWNEGNTCTIQWKKGFPFLAVVVAIVLGLVVLAVLIVSWLFFKEVTSIVPSSIVIIGIIVGIALMAVFAYVLARRQFIGGKT